MFVKQANSAQTAAAAAKTSSSINIALEIAGRVAVAQQDLTPRDNSPAANAGRDTLQKQILGNIQGAAVSPLDKLKAIVVVRELQGSTAALNALRSEEGEFIGNDSLAADAKRLGAMYLDGRHVLSGSDRRRLEDDLGWFGQLAVSQGEPADSPDRAAVIHTARNSFFALIGLVVVFLAAFGLGILLLTLMIVLFSLGKATFAFRAMARGGEPIFLETFALWGVGFLGLLLAVRPIKSLGSTVFFEFLFVILTTLIALWPLARGRSLEQLRQSLGWHRGRGFFREIGAGIVGYLAGLPVLAVGIVITLLLSKIGHANPTHPIQQEFAGPLPWTKILGLLVTVSVFAPFLEETMFRGALYSHLRSRWNPWISAGIVSLLFAAIHPQGWAGIPVLASIALVLAMLREWRGSLIASMTGHALNNGAVLIALVLALR